MADPQVYRADMRVDGLIFADEALIEQIKKDQGPEQVANVATLPGIQKASLAMPDIHWGYGFCIGGVAATDPEEGGVISPGGVGYDINCGVRLLRTNLDWDDVKRPDPAARRPALPRHPDRRRPARAATSSTSRSSTQLMEQGSAYVVDQGWGTARDLDVHRGRRPARRRRPRPRQRPRLSPRGYDQCGTLGSGNHFLEVQVVDRVLDEEAAAVMGLREGQVTVLIHSGSRGLGYQVCDDALAVFKGAPKKYGFELPDRQLACAPVRSPEGQAYLGAMRAAANFAWCNRQLLTHQAREVFAQVFGRPWETLGHGPGLRRRPQHRQVRGARRRRRRAASRSASTARGRPAPSRRATPRSPTAYRAIGQPVIIPGNMGTASWVLAGQPGSMEQSFGTTCHGAGRMMSRTAAVKLAAGRRIDKELDALGIIARARGHKGLAEEQPAAYKDVDQVVEVVDKAGISKKVARLRPVGVIKG